MLLEIQDESPRKEESKTDWVAVSAWVEWAMGSFGWQTAQSQSVTQKSTFTQPVAGAAASRPVIQGSSDFISCLPLPGDRGRERERDAGSPLTSSSGL